MSFRFSQDSRNPHMLQSVLVHRTSGKHQTMYNRQSSCPVYEAPVCMVCPVYETSLQLFLPHTLEPRIPDKMSGIRTCLVYRTFHTPQPRFVRYTRLRCTKRVVYETSFAVLYTGHVSYTGHFVRYTGFRCTKCSVYKTSFWLFRIPDVQCSGTDYSNQVLIRYHPRFTNHSF